MSQLPNFNVEGELKTTMKHKPSLTTSEMNYSSYISSYGMPKKIFVEVEEEETFSLTFSPFSVNGNTMLHSPHEKISTLIVGLKR